MARFSAVPLAAVIAALVFRAFASPAPWTWPGQQAKCDSRFLAWALPPGASIESATAVAENGTYGEGAADILYPTNPTGLPALCAVIVKVISSRESSYRFGLFLPAQWNNRFLAIGLGGFGGGINWLDMGPGTHYGFATISTDTGHNSSVADLTWALDNPESKTDWGWRALHGSVVIGKQLTKAYYGSKPKYSYYSGCSTGGRQGLKEIQISPDSFDGALIGAPAWDTDHLNVYVTALGIYNLPADDTNPNHIPVSLFSVIADEVVRQCDAADGVQDGIVSSPELCTFDYTPLLCADSATNTSTCLTAAQVSTAKKIYSDWYSSSGQYLYPGLTLSSEDQWWILLGGTAPSAFGVGYAQYFLYDDPGWDWATDFNDSVLKDAERMDPGQATADRYDISAFKDRGGKVLMYHGVADGLVPTKGSELYYNRTVETFGGLEKTSEFFRLFLIPGMQHCAGTVVDAPWYIAAAFQADLLGKDAWSTPGFKDKNHDALLALMDWVEKDDAPEEIVATAWKSQLDPTSGVLAQRPLCPWPKKARWDGVGDVNSAASWRCS